MLLIAPLGIWGLYVCGSLTGFAPDPHVGLLEGDFGFFAGLAAVLTAVCVPALLHRLEAFRSTFARGIVVSGVVDDVFFARDRGHVGYAYPYQDEAHYRINLLVGNRITRALRKDQWVSVVLDPAHPRRAWIAELYARPESVGPPGSPER